MRIFVYEWACCEPLSAETAPLRPQGWAMLSAVMEDLGRISGVDPVALLASDFAPVPFPCLHVDPPGERSAFLALAGAADESLVIAPELDGILYERCRWVEEAGGRLLGPSSEAVRLTGDKLSLAAHLERHAIPTPPTVPLSHSSPLAYPVVCKRRDGAGSTDTSLVSSEEELASLRRRADAERFVVQPFVPGHAVSVAFLIGPGKRVSLLPTAQHLSTDGRFHYLGGSAPLPPELAERARSLADRALATVPGLRGYVGVDLVLGEREGWLIEINPRLTTSYVGIRRLALVNLAEAMLNVAREVGGPSPCWREGQSRWGTGEVGGE